MSYSSAFVRYTTKELSSKEYAPLNAVDERKLLLEYKNGSQEAFDKLVKAYLRFVIFLIKGFQIPNDIEIMDVVQEGNVGLVEGIMRFDTTRYDCRVSTYCVQWILFFIRKLLDKTKKSREIFFALPDTENLSVEYADKSFLNDDYQKDVACDIIKHAFEDLNDREKMIIELYYGLTALPKTLQEISSMLHIHIERVRQIRDNARKKINKDLISKLAHNQ